MSNFRMDGNDQHMNAAENSNLNAEFDPTLDADWEALEGILFENDVIGEDENCIRINPISSSYSVSQKLVNSSTGQANASLPMVNIAPASSFATTNISSYLQQSNLSPETTNYSAPYSYPTNYPSQMMGNQFGYYNNADLNQVNYVGSEGTSKKSVEFEEFLRSPAARELFEGSPQYSFSSIGQIDGAKAPTRKLKRDEAFGVSPSSSSAAIYDDEGADGIKAMRGGSLGRVIASSVAVASFVDQDRNARLFSGDGRTLDPTILNDISLTNKNQTTSTNSNSNNVATMTKEEEKKQLMSQFFQKLNRCDISGLVKIIRHCDVGCILSTPDVLEPIVGRSDIMMLISLFIEAYPDGIWTPSTIVVTGDTVTCSYRFMGTRVFDHPINTLYRQIKTHIGSIIAASSEHHQIDFFSDNNRDTLLLVNEVAEGAVPTDSHHANVTAQPPISTSGTSCNNSSASAVWEWQGREQNAYKQYRDQLEQIASSGAEVISTNSSPRDTMVPGEEDSALHPNNKIMFRRRSRSLREVKEIETAVLEEGPTMYRRKLEFIFNEYNEIVQIVFTNLL